MNKNMETLAEIKARKEAKEMSGMEMARAGRYSQKITEVRGEYKKLTGREYGSDGYFVFRYEIYEGWIEDLEEPENWKVDSVAVDEQGNQFKAVGPEGSAWATKWEARNWKGVSRAGERQTPDRPEKEPEKNAVTKSFELGPATDKILIELADMLDKSHKDIVIKAIHDMGVKYDIVDGS